MSTRYACEGVDPTARYPHLGFDPSPGDAAEMAALGRAAQRVVVQLQSVREELQQIRSVGACWQGTAATEFQGLLRRLPVTGQTAEDAFALASSHLLGWSETLTDLQQQARFLEREAEDAFARLQRAKLAADPLQQLCPSMPLSGGPAPVTSGLGPLRADNQVSEATAALEAVRERARDLRSRAEDRVVQAQTALQRASAAAPPTPGHLERLGDWFGELNRAAGNTVNEHADGLGDTADAAALVGPVVSFAGVPGKAVGVGLGVLSLGAHTALAVYADGSKMDAAIDVLGVGVGGLAMGAGTWARGARASERAGVVRPPTWWRPSTWAGDDLEAVEQGADGAGSALGLHGAAGSAQQQLGRTPPSSDDPTPRLQLASRLPGSPPEPRCSPPVPLLPPALQGLQTPPGPERDRAPLTPPARVPALPDVLGSSGPQRMPGPAC